MICRSNFSFLKGGSSPEELIERAKYLGYKSIAITDEVSVAGLVRAHKAAKKNTIKLICGSQFWVKEKNLSLFYNLILLVKNKTGWKELCKLITIAREKSRKKDIHYPWYIQKFKKFRIKYFFGKRIRGEFGFFWSRI